MQAGDITFLGDRWGKAGLVQIQHAVVSSVVSGSTAMPLDDTIPQNTEGVEIITCTITPRSAANLLLIIANIFPAYSTTNAPTGVALFQDSTADALAAVRSYPYTATPPVTLIKQMTAGTVSETTFKVRVGLASAGTVYINTQVSTTRYAGGVASTTLTIFEYAQ